MMGQEIYHIQSELEGDLEKEKKEIKAIDDKRQHHQKQLYKLLAEMLETEKIYVQDLEEVKYLQFYILLYSILFIVRYVRTMLTWRIYLLVATV